MRFPKAGAVLGLLTLLALSGGAVVLAADVPVAEAPAQSAPAHLVAIDDFTSLVVFPPTSVPAGASDYAIEVINSDGTSYWPEVLVDDDGSIIAPIDPWDVESDDGTYVRLWTADGTGTWRSSNAALASYSNAPPVYDGTPHHPGDGKPIDPTKHPVFRGGDSFKPNPKSEIPPLEDGKIPPGKPKGPSVNTDPNNPIVKKFEPRQIIELPAELEIVQQGKDPMRLFGPKRR